jgi:hypothetical protein
VPRPAPTAEQHAFPDHLQQRGAEAQNVDPLTADFQRKLQQPPTVIPPPGQTGAPGAAGKNAFGLEN